MDGVFQAKKFHQSFRHGSVRRCIGRRLPTLPSSERYMHVLRGVRLCLAGAQPQLLNLLWSQRHGSSNMDWSGRLYTPHSLARAPACEDHPIWGGGQTNQFTSGGTRNFVIVGDCQFLPLVLRGASALTILRSPRNTRSRVLHLQPGKQRRIDVP